MFSFDPFEEIFETEKFPHARTRRTDFFQKMKDTFYVFAGLAVPDEKLLFNKLLRRNVGQITKKIEEEYDEQSYLKSYLRGLD